MRALRGIVLTGASILALTACQTIKSATDPTAGTFERAADLGAPAWRCSPRNAAPSPRHG